MLMLMLLLWRRDGPSVDDWFAVWLMPTKAGDIDHVPVYFDISRPRPIAGKCSMTLISLLWIEIAGFSCESSKLFNALLECGTASQGLGSDSARNRQVYT